MTSFKLTGKDWDEIYRYAQVFRIQPDAKTDIESAIRFYLAGVAIDNESDAQFQDRHSSMFLASMSELLAGVFGSDAVKKANARGLHKELSALMPQFKNETRARKQGRIYNAELYWLIYCLDELVFRACGEHLGRGKPSLRFAWAVCKVAIPGVDEKTVRYGLREVQENIIPSVTEDEYPDDDEPVR